VGQGTKPKANKSLHVGFRDAAPHNVWTLAFYADDINSVSTRKPWWQNWVSTYDSTTKEQRIYLDGKLDATRIATANFSGTGVLTLGNAPFTSGNFFGGVADELIIESRAWTAKEVETYYRKSNLNYRQSKFAQFLQSINITDTMSLLDVTTGIRSRVVNVTDTLGMTDTISAIRAYVVNLVDTMNLSETLTSLRSRIASITDSLGLTDSVRARKKWRNTDKNEETFTNTSKNLTSWTNEDKSSTSWTNVDKN